MITRSQERRIRALRRYTGMGDTVFHPLQAYDILATLEKMAISKSKREDGWETSDRETLNRIVRDHGRMVD